MLAPGDDAPGFSGVDQHGDEVSLADFSGQRVVLYFYPKDNTPGCTKEACSFRDRFDAFTAEDIAVIGVSADSVDSHQSFADKYDLPFSLIADPEKDIIDAYDVRGAFGNAKRVTYVIGEDGSIEQVYTDVDTEQHAKDILADLE